MPFPTNLPTENNNGIAICQALEAVYNAISSNEVGTYTPLAVAFVSGGSSVPNTEVTDAENQMNTYLATLPNGTVVGGIFISIVSDLGTGLFYATASTKISKPV